MYSEFSSLAWPAWLEFHWRYSVWFRYANWQFLIDRSMLNSMLWLLVKPAWTPEWNNWRINSKFLGSQKEKEIENFLAITWCHRQDGFQIMALFVIGWINAKLPVAVASAKCLLQWHHLSATWCLMFYIHHRQGIKGVKWHLNFFTFLSMQNSLFLCFMVSLNPWLNHGSSIIAISGSERETLITQFFNSTIRIIKCCTIISFI